MKYCSSNFRRIPILQMDIDKIKLYNLLSGKKKDFLNETNLDKTTARKVLPLYEKIFTPDFINKNYPKIISNRFNYRNFFFIDEIRYIIGEKEAVFYANETSNQKNKLNELKTFISSVISNIDNNKEFIISKDTVLDCYLSIDFKHYNIIYLNYFYVFL